MAISIRRLGKARKAAHERKEASGGTSSLKRVVEGITVIAICPPSDAMDGLPFVRADQHFRLAPGVSRPAFSLAEDNTGIWHPETQRQLAEINDVRKESGKHVVDVSEFVDAIDEEEPLECPIQAVLDGSDPDMYELSEALTSDRAKQMRRKENHFWVYVPLEFAPLDDPYEFKEVKRADQRPFLLPAPQTLHLQLIEKVEEVVRVHDRDPTDPEEVTLFKIKYYQDSNGFMTYDVEFETMSLTEPVALSKGVRAQIRKMCVEEGDADPFRFIAATLQDAGQILKTLKGNAVREEPAGRGEDKPGCYGEPGEIDSDDPECQGCSFKKGCAAETDSEAPPDPKGSKGKKKEKEEPKPKGKKKASKKKEKEEPKPKGKKKAAKKPPKPECFGDDEYYDGDDEACQECSHVEVCAEKCTPDPGLELEEEKPACFGDDEYYDGEDKACQECPFVGACAEECGEAPPWNAEEELSDPDPKSEEEKPPKKKGTRVRRRVDEEDKKPKKGAKKKASAKKGSKKASAEKAAAKKKAGGKAAAGVAKFRERIAAKKAKHGSKKG